MKELRLDIQKLLEEQQANAKVYGFQARWGLVSRFSRDLLIDDGAGNGMLWVGYIDTNFRFDGWKTSLESSGS